MTEPGASFRDPEGSSCLIDGRILRVVGADSAAEYEAFLQMPSARGFLARRQLVQNFLWIARWWTEPRIPE